MSPKSATEIATNAKWYHMVTLKIRVSTISYMSVESVIRNNPANVPGRARGGCGEALELTPWRAVTSHPF